jgi:hypothetical protein
MNDASELTSIERLRSLIGVPSTGEWFSVTGDKVRAFEVASYFEEDGEDDDPYPDGLVEGFHLLALLDHFGGQANQIDSTGFVGWNYGLNRARFVTPVFVGTDLRLQSTLTEVTEKGDGYLLTVEYIAELRDSSRPAFTAEMVVYWRPVDEATP